ncbi:MAG: metal ABC transporter permease [Candidatus Hydrogenedentes bacterium]|nr:metal ABC transporter permease [Candidatus Hydrogenedentota bacterium]
MGDFWLAVAAYPLARNALLAALLVSVACGVVGSYVVVRRITYIAAGVAHCVLGGLGAARYLSVTRGWDWLRPEYGALAAALAAAGLIGWISLRHREREDTVISAVWSVGMAAGILFLHATPGYNQDLMGYLFGNILLVTGRGLWFLLLLDAVILGLAALFFRPFLAVCFDEEFVRLRNLPADAYYLLLLAMTALTVVALSMVVGVVLVIALLTLPAAAAGRFAGSLLQMMAGAAVLCALFCVAGLTVSYRPDWPAGPVIILIAGAAYLVAALAPRLLRRAPRAGK